MPLFSQSTAIILLICFLTAFHILIFLFEKNKKAIYLKRFVEFAFFMLIGGFIFGIFGQSLRFNASSIQIAEYIVNHHPILSAFNINKLKIVLIYSSGILITANEINNLVRYILQTIDIRESKEGENDNIESQEIKKGKIIGIIERIMFFFFVITGNYTSIAFVLTAKGITRYKALDDKKFAEYVLIGTLLSSTLAIVGAYLAKSMVTIIR
ncbi:MAG: hypothetical protein K9M99_05205 [Candidatus Cloacimonetes bacterium]|nr:hypothetical protein [Candidatus Cloacimonadota bacterium]